jgi:hypothetical protein
VEDNVADCKQVQASEDLSSAAQARRLAERGLHEQAIGHNEEADGFLIQAQEMDLEAVADVLREHDAARAPDARLQSTTDQDVERVLPRIKPGPEQSSE